MTSQPGKQTVKNHSQNMVEKLFPNLFLKNQNWSALDQ